MEDQAQIEQEATEPHEGIVRQGKRRIGSVAVFETTSTGEQPSPVITTVHQPPKPKGPYWRVPEAAKAKLKEAQADAEKARQAIEQIEGRFRDRERDLDDLKRNIRIKRKECDVFLQGLARIDPSTLAQSWETAYWAHFHDPFDRDRASQWLLVASLRANSKDLRAMLTKKLEEAEGSIAAMEKERAELEKELGAEETKAA